MWRIHIKKTVYAFHFKLQRCSMFPKQGSHFRKSRVTLPSREDSSRSLYWRERIQKRDREGERESLSGKRKTESRVSRSVAILSV